MLLQCTLVRGPGAAQATGPVELTIELPAGCSGADVEAAMARRFGTGMLSVAGLPLAGLTAGAEPLVNGAVLVDGAGVVGGAGTVDGSGGPLSHDSGPSAGPPLLLAVLSGPGAGMVLPLRRGRYRVGRSGTELILPDPDLSREHAQLDVGPSGVMLADLGSANGTTVDGTPVGSARVSSDSVIGCGQSTLGLIVGSSRRGTAGEGTPAALSGAGSDTTEPLRVPSPGAPPNRAALVLTAVLPLAVGVALAVITGMWMFLAFSGFSAVSVLVPALSGRRRRRELAAAVAAAAAADAARRRRAAPPAVDLLLSPGAQADGDDEAEEAGPVWLRLGLAPGMARIRLDPDDPSFRAPPLGAVPVCLNPNASTRVGGPARDVAGLVRFLVMQLAGYPRAGRTRILLHGPPDSLPLAARFLSQVSLSADVAGTAARVAAGPGAGFDRGVLFVMAGAADTGSLCATAARAGWQVLDCSASSPDDSSPDDVGQSVLLADRGAVLATGATRTPFTPDLVPTEVFDRYCRRARRPPGPAGVAGRIPDVSLLPDLLPLSAGGIRQSWAAARRDPGGGLPVPVGLSASGPVRLDLQADGPHVLVAGTTGSGKSEFLRTLVAGLAATYPPDVVNLLFVDFKGGSGLGPLTGLPHCVGILTDLSVPDVARSLASLRAEVRWREELLAGAGVPDLAAYQVKARHPAPGCPPLPHLVLVIDEFRMLVEDAPAALGELMRIAAIGRSLGIHLVMATQRPQGALSADIRANVTSSVVLRVQSELESSDIMNSRLAAAIPLNRPGRAYLVRGSGAPEGFQTATLAPPRNGPGGRVQIWETAALLGAGAADLPSVPAMGGLPNPAEAAAPVVELASRLWAEQGGPLPRRPVARPLPAPLPFPLRRSRRPAASSVPGVLLGLSDVPEFQRLQELEWLPGSHGHLALIGSTDGGTPDSPSGTARSVAGQLLDSTKESHLYMLDANGALDCLADSPRVGAWAGLHELRRAVRVLERVAGEIRVRLAPPGTADAPPLVLVLNGWGSWASALRSGPLAWAEDLVHDIIRDGQAAGVTAIVSGGRELVSARFFAALPNRVFFPAGSTEESRHGWPRLPDLAPVPGRVAVAGPFAEPAPHAAQLYEPPSPGPSGRRSALPADRRPFRVEPLPARVGVAEVRARVVAAGPSPAFSGPALAEPGPRLWVGVGGDELLPMAVPFPSGRALAVLGRGGSGKSSLLRALPGLNPGRTWLHPGAGQSPDSYWAAVLRRALAGELKGDLIALADDADLAGPETNRYLAELNGLGWAVVLTAGFGPGVLQRVPLALQARVHGMGILIGARTPGDPDLFGIRLEPEDNPPPGRAVVVLDGRPTAVQLAVEGSPPDGSRGTAAGLKGTAAGLEGAA